SLNQFQKVETGVARRWVEVPSRLADKLNDLELFVDEHARRNEPVQKNVIRDFLEIPSGRSFVARPSHFYIQVVAWNELEVDGHIDGFLGVDFVFLVDGRKHLAESADGFR